MFTHSDPNVATLTVCSALAQPHACTLTCADTFVSLIQPQKANADTDLSVDISERIKKEENHSTWLRTGVIRVSAASVCAGFDCVMKGRRDGGSISETAIQDDRQQWSRLVFPKEESNIDVFFGFDLLPSKKKLFCQTLYLLQTMFIPLTICFFSVIYE